MTDTALLEQVADDLFHRVCPPEVTRAAEHEGWAPKLWQAVEAAGLSLVGVPEAAGGAGGWPEAAALLRTAGYHAVPLPLAETGVLGGWLLASAGLDVPTGPLGVAPVERDPNLILTRAGAGWELRGTVRRMPWGRCAARFAVLARAGSDHLVASVDPADCEIRPGHSLAGEPRDVVTFNGVPLGSDVVAVLPPDLDAGALFARGALARALQMVGALERAVDLAVSYAQVREQFGRPISRFQIIQQELAIAAGEVCAARGAVDAAVVAAEQGGGWEAIAAAKVRAGAAAGVVARIAHQVHGAIGFTHEHPLQLCTRRLWSWRDEFGGEAFWAERLGRAAAAAGPGGLWELLTRSPG